MDARRWNLAWTLLVLAGCGGGGGTTVTDSGTAPTDSGSTPLPVATVMGGAPDWSCLGMRTAPTGGAPVATTITFREALPPTPPISAGQTVHIFPNNTLADTCTGSCISAMTDSAGAVTANLPANGWYAYRILAGPVSPGSDPALTESINRAAPAMAGAVTQTFISQATFGATPAAYLRSRASSTTAISGATTDC